MVHVAEIHCFCIRKNANAAKPVSGFAAFALEVIGVTNGFWEGQNRK